MNVYTLKSYLSSIVLACLTLTVNAQFDDVYYDPDNTVITDNGYDDSSYESEYTEEVTYYDDDEYEYYDDYDYYYTSRIRRFQHYSSGFDFYDPWYTSYSYYDPYDYSAYYYPGASIYISFGNADYWSYRNWRRWNRYNSFHRYNSWNNWCLTPSSYYYSYNSWCAPSYNYWGGHHGYHSYSNYYNNYYNSCPSPLSNYYGVTHSTVNNVNNGGRGSYYGPRIAGNTGSSPRGPGVKPENIQPVLGETAAGVSSEKNTFTKTREQGINGGGTNPTGNVVTAPVEAPQNAPRTELPSSRDGQVGNASVDKEVKKDDTTPFSKRPVFRPYPSNENSPSRPADERVTPKAGDVASPRTNDKTDHSPVRNEEKPQYRPQPSDRTERPSYTPPAREEKDRPAYTPRNEERPSYTPPSRSEKSERPSYSPPSRSERSEERPNYSPPQRSESPRSNDRPSYSPPSRGDSGGSHSAPSRDNSSSRSSGGSSSPRSRG